MKENLTDQEKQYYTQQADVIPNKILGGCMLGVAVVLLICLVLTETGAFRVSLQQMRTGAITAIFFLLVPQLFRMNRGFENPAVKYLLLFCTAVVMYILTTLLMFHTTMALILPMIVATFYKTPKMAHFAVICSIIITAFSPVMSFINGLWDSLFLQVLLQFCGYDSAPALQPFFTTAESVRQILLYIVFPRLMIVLLIGVGIINIVKSNALALQDRLSLIRSNARISAMQEDTLRCLATIVESRDGNTGTHVIHTREYMHSLVQQALLSGCYGELTEEKAAYIVRASVLHDVGKVAIPDNILNKPGKLTPEEYTVMKTHCQEGDKFISKAFAESPDALFVTIAHEIVSCHHEKVDGTGYPNGLAGEEIPLAARMMAIVDAFDAITSERVYKPAKSPEEALAILRKDSGTHFDAGLVELFVTAYKSYAESKTKEIKNEYS